MIQGHLIVLEGIDGSGTSTQAGMLKQAFTLRGLPAHVTAEPSAGPVGCMIRQILAGRLVVRGSRGVLPPDWKTMSLLFAADRQDHLASEIEPNLMDGVSVICDRYLYSSVVYQSVSAGRADARDWITQINYFVRKPDLVLYLNVDPQEARRRRQERDFQVEIFDDPEFQEQLVKKYHSLSSMFPDINIVTVDAGRSVAEVAEACWHHVEKMRNHRTPV